MRGLKTPSMIISVVLILALILLSYSKSLAEERFIDNGDGTITDTKTNLMWAQYDNMGDINWHQAKDYCEHIILSKYEDWRMPTIKELATLYDPNEKGYETDCGNWVKVNPIIHLSCGWVWAIEAKTITAYAYNFTKGYQYTDRKVHRRHFRALPVRTIKK
ncbi:MAG: hypothetical protein DRP55_05805 [Spirochaetes bacterium]|nr:DUF1566 domain-containing protein [Deltaproteobacteria bacterium]RKY00410.1 MAG: hypothetical protein DRP55_05805 [Spirochaetota bacterium]RLA91802.1 MAG: hypothetical protein DRG20_00255 [Deltaproteobacteria bacterium]